MEASVGGDGSRPILAAGFQRVGLETRLVRLIGRSPETMPD